MSNPRNPEQPQDAWTSPFEGLLGEYSSPPTQPDPMFGTPGHDVAHWDGKQSFSNTCAIRCQEFVLQQFFGYNVDERALVQEAMQHGWYNPGDGTPENPGGTSPRDVGNLLELHGIPVNRYENASVFHLANELAQGHKVIIGVNTEMLWPHATEEDATRAAIKHALGMAGANHAVVVSGIDTRDPDHVQVIISDPGTGQPAATYPLEQFTEAWRDSHFTMVSTQMPVPAHNPEMAHFNYGAGHIPEVAGMPYEQFVEYQHHPHDWEPALHHYVESHHYGDAADHIHDETHDADLHHPDSEHHHDVDPGYDSEHHEPHTDDDAGLDDHHHTDTVDF